MFGGRVVVVGRERVWVGRLLWETATAVVRAAGVYDKRRSGRELSSGGERWEGEGWRAWW